MKTSFRFVDLFAGIGGFHQACKHHGGSCVLACDIDPQARETYRHNYGIEPVGDIHSIKKLPPCDVVCAGFPCVTFSTIGKRAGSEDPRGRLFFEIIRLIRTATPKPKFIVFENVKGLLSMPDEFQAFQTALKRIGYIMTHQLLDAQNFGVPQHRERVFIVASLKSTPVPITTPSPTAYLIASFNDIRDATLKTKSDVKSLVTKRFVGKLLKKPIITNKGRTILRARINNFINKKLFSSNGVVGTLCATFIPYVYDESLKVPRRMTPREMLRCQGFPDTFEVPFGRSTTARLSGNAVCVPVATWVIKHVVRYLKLVQ